MPKIVIIGTCDTKLQELLSLRSKILENGDDVNVCLVDVGRAPTQHADIDISHKFLIDNHSPSTHEDISKLSRSNSIAYMRECATNWLRESYNPREQGDQDAIRGIVSAGGTGGTSLASGVMRAVLPIGFPKLIVSTNASADVSPVVGETDITMMPSIVDVAGSNELLQRVFGNAAGAICGMARSYERFMKETAKRTANQQRGKRRVGLTMFGVTTPCCDQIRGYLEDNYPIEVFVFHCTGTGGKAMERLVQEGGLDAVCDVTTTEICDQIAGGVMDAGPDRLAAPLKAGIPYLLSVGATDMVNFGPRNTVPEKYHDRNLYEHNSNVTLMRTDAKECKAIGRFIVEKIKTHLRDDAEVQLILPTGGVSLISTPGQPFFDGDADQSLFDAIKNGLAETRVQVISDTRSINDSSFALDLAKRLVKMMKL